MTSIKQLHDAIVTRFQTQITIGQSLPTQFDGDPTFSQPTNSAWCRFTVIPGTQGQRHLGTATRRDRRDGVASAQIFVPVGTGRATLMTFAAAVETAFNQETDSGVTYRTPSTGQARREGDDWWQVTVTCPFYADTTA